MAVAAGVRALGQEQKSLKTEKRSKGKSWPVLALSIYWLSCLAFISFRGNFPLNDDWIYAESVHHFLQTGELRLLACAPACIFHILFGATVCSITGFSHETLRLSGVFFAYLATLAVYGSARELKAGRGISFVLAALFAVNPMIVNLAFSFMTDIPALALGLSYVYLTIKGLRLGSPYTLFCAALCLCAGVLVRQNLAVLALANGLVLLGLWLRRKHSWIVFGGLVAAPILLAVAGDRWMLGASDFPALYIWYKGQIGIVLKAFLQAPIKLLPTFAQLLSEQFFYMGLFCAPVLICFLKPLFKTLILGSKALINALTLCLASTLMTFGYMKYVLVDHKLMPFNQNLLRLPDVGAQSIMGVNFPALSEKVRTNLTLSCAMFGFLALSICMETTAKGIRVIWRSIECIQTGFLSDGAERRRFARLAAIGLTLAAFLSNLTVIVLQSTFSDIDRYYVFPFAFSLLLLALASRWFKVGKLWLATLPFVVIYAVYSACACQDQLSWNRARWDALSKLEASGIAPGAIDGGAEYNYFSNPPLFKNIAIHPTYYEFTHKGDSPRNNWRWWSVDREDYIISFNGMPDYELVFKEKYWSALAAKEKEIFVLKRVSP